MNSQSTLKSERKKSCVNCGAELTYEPGTEFITCDYCNHKESIEKPELAIKELELHTYLDKLGQKSHSTELSMLHCKNCGANQHVEQNFKSLHCIYCTMPLILEDLYQDEWIVPGAVVPFQVNQDKAHQIFKTWIKGLWWAPNALKRASLSPENTKGLYAPFWTFDAQLNATYTGQRGDYYYVTTTVGSGKNKKQVRKRKTRWRLTSGTVSGFVDDTLVKATKKKESQLPAQVCHWDLSKLTTFNTKYLAGYTTEKYTLSLNEGHLEANQQAQEIARNWVKRQIGGDVQRITTMNLKLTDETFKHVLLPVYISSYKFKSKIYHFYVNGQTGKIYGKRPYSFWKITSAIILGLIVFLTIYYFTR